MSLDTRDLEAIKAIVEGSFSNVPLKVVTGLSEGRVQHIQLYAVQASANYWTLRIERVGTTIVLDWYDINNESMAKTILRGV